MKYKMLNYILCAALVIGTLGGVFRQLPAHADSGAAITETADAVTLTLGNTAFQFNKTGGTWAFDGAVVGGVQTVAAKDGENSFFDGSGRASSYTKTEEGTVKALSFTNGTWTAVYQIDTAKSIPAFRVKFEGVGEATVTYQTAGAGADQRGSWVTRAFVGADKQGAKGPNSIWQYIDGANPTVFGHSLAGGVDAQYVFLPKLSLRSASYGSTLHSETYFKSWQTGSGADTRGMFALQMRAAEPKEFDVIFDRADGGRLNDVMERYYSPVVDYLFEEEGLDITDLDIDPVIGDQSMEKAAYKLQNPAGFVPGYGWRMKEINPAVKDYPYTATVAGMHDQAAVYLYYEGLATGRDWEKNYGSYIMQNTPYIISEEPAEVTLNDNSKVRSSNGIYYPIGGVGVSGAADGTAADGYCIAGNTSSLKSGIVWDANERLEIWLDQPHQIYFLGQMIDENDGPEMAEMKSKLSNLYRGIVKGYSDHLMDYDNMLFSRWMDPQDLSRKTTTRDNETNPLVPKFANMLILAARSETDSAKQAAFYANADRILDWTKGFMADETKMDYFAEEAALLPCDVSFWQSTVNGDYVNALIDKYNRTKAAGAADETYLEMAKDVFWIAAMWFGTTPKSAGVSCGSMRGGADFDMAPNMCPEQGWPVYRSAALLGETDSEAYTKFYSIAYRKLAYNRIPNVFEQDLTGTVLRTFYDTEIRAMNNLMFSINKSTNKQVAVIEKKVPLVDTGIKTGRDIVAANGTPVEQQTTLQIRFLEPGSYTVIMDGQPQTKTAAELEEGIALTLPANSSKKLQVTQTSAASVTAPNYQFDTSVTYVGDLDDCGSIRMDKTSGQYWRNATFKGGKINLNGTSYDKGVTMLGNSAVFYDLGGQYQKFQATVGIDQTANEQKASVEFQVLVDGRVAWRSGVMRKTDAPKEVDVDVTGAQMLSLRLTNAYDEEYVDDDMGDYANARLVGKDQSITPPASLLSYEGAQPPEVIGPDLAKNKPIAASSAFQPASWANDYNTNPGMFWAGTSFPSDITVDLGSIVNVRTVVLGEKIQFDENTYQIRIMGSEDGAAYTELLPSQLITIGPEQGNMLRLDLPQTRTARYVKVEFEGGFTRGGPKLSAFRVYGSTDVVEISRGKFVTASSSADLQNNGPEQLTDGTGAYWCSEINGTDVLPWAQIDLGAPERVNKLALEFVHGGDYAGERKNFKIEGCNYPAFDRGVTLLAQQGDEAASGDRWEAPAEDSLNKFRYIRVSKTAADAADPAGSKYWSLKEIKAYALSTGDSAAKQTLSQKVEALQERVDRGEFSQYAEESQILAVLAEARAMMEDPISTDADFMRMAARLDQSAADLHELANLTLKQKASAGGCIDTANNGPDKAVDGSKGTYWCGDGTAANQWLQVQLKKPSQIYKLEFTAKINSDTPASFRTNFKILGSNDPAFSEAVTLAECGSEDVGVGNTWKAESADTENYYQYLRVVRTANVSYWGIAELTAFGVEDPNASDPEPEGVKLLSQGKTTTAGGSVDPTYNGPNRATDGNAGTYWCGDNTASHQWLQVDLGTASNIWRLEMTAKADASAQNRTNFKVEASNDASFATGVAELAVCGTDDVGLRNTWTAASKDHENTYRYVRISKTENMSYWSIAKFEVYGIASEPVVTPEPEEVTLLSQGKTGSASSNLDAKNNGPGLTLDDGEWSYWCSNGNSALHWLQVDLGAEAKIWRVQMLAKKDEAGADQRTNFKVEASNDPSFAAGVVELAACGTDDVGKGNLWTAASKDHENTYRYVRISKTSPMSYWKIATFEVYGIPKAVE